MVGWELVDGHELETAIERLFVDPRAVYLHVHYAAPGATRQELTGSDAGLANPIQGNIRTYPGLRPLWDML